MNTTRKFFQIIFILLVVFFLFFLSVYTLSEEKYTWNKLVREADYVVNVSRNIMRCEETDRYYAMCHYVGKEPYSENRKTHTEVYIVCDCHEKLGEKITIVTDNNYFTDNGAYYTLFLKCINKEKGLYTPVNGNTGILKWEYSKILKSMTCNPLDPQLRRDNLQGNFRKYICDDYTFFCSQNNPK